MKKTISITLALIICLFSLSVSATTTEQDLYAAPQKQIIRYDSAQAVATVASNFTGDITNETRRQVFEAIYASVKDFSLTINLSQYQIPFRTVSGQKASVVQEIVQEICDYYPDAYYINGFSYGFGLGASPNYVYKIQLAVKPGYTKAIYQKQLDFCEKELTKIIASIPKNSSDLQKIVYIHDYLVSKYSYDTSYSIYDMYGFLSQKTGVCQAYTHVFKAIMDRLGIECHTAVSREDNHIWNVVKLGGKYYYIDCTSDDPIYDRPGSARHTNLLLSYNALIAQENHTNPQNEPSHLSYTCNDTTFESSALTLTNGVIFEYGGDRYGVTATLPQKIIKYNSDFSSYTTVATYSSGYTSASYNVSVVKIGEEIYFNDVKTLVKYNLRTGTKTVVATFSSVQQIFNCYLSADGKIGANAIINNSADYTNSAGLYYNICIGDLNGDKTVTALDLAILKQYILTGESSVANIQGLADVNRDGLVNLLDILRMKNFVAGNIDYLCA